MVLLQIEKKFDVYHQKLNAKKNNIKRWWVENYKEIVAPENDTVSDGYNEGGFSKMKPSQVSKELYQG